MKTFTTFFLFLISFTITAQIVNIPDANFKAYLVGNTQINTNGDAEIQVSEANSFAGNMDCSSRNIFTLTGIEFFTNIKFLDCSSNKLANLDLTKNTNLTFVICTSNLLTNINVTKCLLLKTLWCSENKLTSIDVTKNTLLDYFQCTLNNLSNIDISKNINLKNIDCSLNSINNLDVSKNIALEILSCNINSLTTIDVSKNVNLISLASTYNQLNSIDISKNSKLISLAVSGNPIKNLDTSKNPALIYLSCSANQLTNLDLNKNLELSTLQCIDNQIESLDLSKHIKLTEVYCNKNQLKSLNIKNGQNSIITRFDAKDNQNLFCIQVDNVAYSNSNWPDKDVSANYNTDCSLGVNDVKKSKIHIYPNPAKDKFTINTTDKIENIEVYSQTGQLLKTANTREINISNLPKGNYIVKIKMNKETLSQKLIKE